MLKYLSIALLGCMACASSNIDSRSAAFEGRAPAKSDAADFCERFGFYGDGEFCDCFCAKPDADCDDMSLPKLNSQIDTVDACDGPKVCGGILGSTCSDGEVCIDDPTDSCDPTNGGADCTGTCGIKPKPRPGCGGIAGLMCAAGETCEYDAACEGQPDCAGVCVAQVAECGGFAGVQCPAGKTCEFYEGADYGQCVDDVPSGMCGGTEGIQCPEGQFCKTDTFGPDASGVCVDEPPAKNCGGFAGILCDRGEKCVPKPGSSWEDLGGDAFGMCVPANANSCGGFATVNCMDGERCVDDPSDACDPNDLQNPETCIGVCEAIPMTNQCGGFAGLRCDFGEMCVDDPSDDCDPNNGGADCIGMCEPLAFECGGFAGTRCPDGEMCKFHEGADYGVCIGEAPKQCGGFAGLQCDAGETCVDDPSDNCDPQNGGADCIGICQSL